jgi:hypothetical protein
VAWPLAFLGAWVGASLIARYLATRSRDR